jgi:hypothetical protein
MLIEWTILLIIQGILAVFVLGAITHRVVGISRPGHKTLHWFLQRGTKRHVGTTGLGIYADTSALASNGSRCRSRCGPAFVLAYVQSTKEIS